MTVTRSVADVLRERVVLEIESIDRLYLNLFQPRLMHAGGVAQFFRSHQGATFASSALMAPLTRAFQASVFGFVAATGVPLVRFRKGQRKDDVMHEHLARFDAAEGVLFVGVAQEKAPVFRTERRYGRDGRPYPWLVRSTAMVNHYYFYVVDADFGPLFIKFCGYFPYTGRVCLNGHEYAKRQAAKAGIAFTALDNGFLDTEDPKAVQRICDRLTPTKIDAVVRKWLSRLPHPFAPADRAAGYRYALSVLQAEFSLTQVLDRPESGRVFFEQVIRDNLDIGRPDKVGLVFDRRITTRGRYPTPGLFRTRVITADVTPSLHVDYKNSKIKQYHKEHRALRTETTINDTYDFIIGKLLAHLPELRAVGFSANRRLLRVQQLSYDPIRGDEAFTAVIDPVDVGAQHAPGLRFGDRRTMALLSALCVFRLLPEGFTNPQLRSHVAGLLGLAPDAITPGRMTYDLRRLRLHGLIERLPASHRYRVTDNGWHCALGLTRVHTRVLRPSLALLQDPAVLPDKIRKPYERLTSALDEFPRQAKLIA
jgi:hypothetical protein